MEKRQRKQSNSVPPDFSLILVGSQRYGVSSVANAIIGEAGFEWGKRTAQSDTHTAQVNGKVIQLVKAPAWLRSYHLCDTTELVKDELVLSVTRCESGPHAFILLVEVDLPFTSACANAVKAHLELHGENVWNHTIVLFTCGDWLDKTTIEEYITGEGHELAELLNRCGQRYVFDSTSTRPTLSQTLLDKIEMLVESNGGRHFEADRNVIQNFLTKREEVEKRAEDRKQRRIKEKEKRDNIAGSSVSEITIVLLGWVFAAKSEIGSVILGTPEIEGRTEKCVKETTVMKNQLKVTVVDTPGWWKFFSANLVPSAVRSEIMKALEGDETTGQTSAKESPDKVSSGRVFLLMIPADTSFTSEQKKIIEDNMKHFGETVWQNTMLVFTRAHWLGNFDIEKHIESEGDALIWLVEQCGNRYFVYADEGKHQSELEDMGEKLVDMVLDMVSKGQSYQTPSNEDKRNTAESQHQTEEKSTEEPVDEDLRKMIEVFHRVWGWGSWEIEEFLARFAQRPLAGVYDNTSMSALFMFEKTSHTREEVEKILRDELCGKSLEEVLEIALQVYFRRECGAFDILSIIFEKDQFKSEWKQLFEREWARREVRLMEYVFGKYTDNKTVDADETHKKSCEKVSAWMDGMPSSKGSSWMDALPPLIKEPIRSVINRLQ